MKAIAPSLLLALGLCSALPAQTPPCFAANDANTTVPGLIYSSGAAPGVFAWQVTPASTIVAQSLQVFSGNAYASSKGAFMSLEVWDETTINPGVPNARLGGGTWRFNAANSWQGANLDTPVVLQAGTPYWIVFIEPGWSTPPYEPGGASLFPSSRFFGGAWIVGTATALKFRMFCGLLDPQGVVPFGLPCADTTGALGTMFSNQSSTVGNASFRLEGSGYPAGAPILNVMGLTAGFPSLPIPGTASCFLSTDWVVTLGDVTGTGTVRSGCSTCATTEAAGHVTFPIPIAASPSLVGFYFAAQLVALDFLSTFPLPFISSNALQVTVF